MSSSTTICGVCLDECGEKNIAITECGHKTHIECLIRVLSTSDNCIYCRKKLNLQCKEQEQQLDRPQPGEIQRFNNNINENLTRRFHEYEYDRHEYEHEHDRENVLKKWFEWSMNAFQVCIDFCIIAIFVIVAIVTVIVILGNAINDIRTYAINNVRTSYL